MHESWFVGCRFVHSVFMPILPKSPVCLKRHYSLQANSSAITGGTCHATARQTNLIIHG